MPNVSPTPAASRKNIPADVLAIASATQPAYAVETMRAACHGVHSRLSCNKIAKDEYTAIYILTLMARPRSISPFPQVMRIRSVARPVVLAVAAACATMLSRGDIVRAATWNPRLASLPPVMFWAWHRPEDLRGLDPRRAGVAYLAATWTLGIDGPRIEPRLQPLLIDPGTPLVAVVRIESRATPPPGYDATQIRGMARTLADAVDQAGALGLQIDFDARESEHEFYRTLLTETRAVLGERPLSMTALVSWCLGNEALLRPPVDEVVPMLFRLGVANAAHLQSMGAAGALRSRACTEAVGVSLDEPTPGLDGRRRLYVFSPTSWTPELAKRVLTEGPRWP